MKRVWGAEQDIFCGPLRAGLGEFLGGGYSNDVWSWFADSCAHYVHKGRVAIHLACELMQIAEGDEILAPAYNCGSEIDALFASGGSVVLYRIDEGGRVDIGDLERRITGKTRLICVTHYFGFAQPTVEIKQICREKGIYLL